MPKCMYAVAYYTYSLSLNILYVTPYPRFKSEFPSHIAFQFELYFLSKQALPFESYTTSLQEMPILFLFFIGLCFSCGKNRMVKIYGCLNIV